MSNKVLIGAVIVVAIGFGIVFATTRPHQSAAQPVITASLASLNTGPAPWLPEYQHLPNRLKAIKIPLLGAEGTAQHIHAHLAIFVHGRRVTVPAEIGIPPAGGITPVHTHDTSGIIHIESPDANAKYTLGQLFDIWGVKLTATSVGGYKNDANNSLAVYDNGQPVVDPPNLVLGAHHEIVITFGGTSQRPAIPATYNFPSGL